jgi:hypothetical protein
VHNLWGSQAGERGEGLAEGGVIKRPSIAAVGIKVRSTNHRGEIPDVSDKAASRVAEIGYRERHGGRTA